MSDTLIEARGLSAGYGKMAVVRDLDLHVDAGEVVALLGANGAGKTTTLLTLAGELAPLEGEVRFLGQPTTAPMHVALPQRPRLRHRGALGDHGHVGRRQPEAGRRRRRRSRSSYFPALERDHGPPRRAAARAASSRCCRWPGPSAATRRCCWPTSCRSGWPRSSSPTCSQAVRAAADERGVGVLLVEQHVRQALKIADRVYVMERGRIVLSGTADEVARPARQDRSRLPHRRAADPRGWTGPPEGDDRSPVTPRRAPESPGARRAVPARRRRTGSPRSAGRTGCSSRAASRPPRRLPPSPPPGPGPSRTPSS